MRWLGLLVALLIISCSTEEQSPFAELEKQVAESPTNASISELLDMYNSWLSEHPETSPERKEILLKSYEVSKQHIRMSNQYNVLKELLLEYPGDSETIDRHVDLTNIYVRQRHQTAAQVMMQLLNIKYAGDPKAQAFAPQIPGDVAPVDTVMFNLARSMFDAQSLRLQQPIARDYIKACEGYALINQGDSLSAENLHKAAETSGSLGQSNAALAIYDWILKYYPDHARTPQALFLKAFTYDSGLKDFDNARIYYQQFLDKYPTDDFAPSAKFLLDNLGKDDEELLKTLQEQADEE